MSQEVLREIMTSRLSLISITPEMIRCEQAGDGRLGRLTGCTVSSAWPPEHWEPHVFVFLLRQFEEHPEQVGWHRYVGLREEDGGRTLIGALGAFSTPGRPWECEIGYGVLPDYQRRGYATEGTRALIEYLRGCEGVTSVIAHTFPALTESVRVMEKCGMRFDGEGAEAGTVRYRRDLEEGAG